MINFSSFSLNNGLRVLVHEDRSTPLVALNLLYGVGSKNEDPDLTGIAHLLEHLMFSGSVNIPVYDLPLQMAGGENNAFTNNDITNYYLTVPGENIETGFWLAAIVDILEDYGFTDTKANDLKDAIEKRAEEREYKASKIREEN